MQEVPAKNLCSKEKQDCRERWIYRRKQFCVSLSPAELARKHRELAKNIRDVLPAQTRTLAVYFPLKFEADPRSLWESCQFSSQRVYPRVQGEDLVFVLPDQRAAFPDSCDEVVDRQGEGEVSSLWSRSPFGVWEPLPKGSVVVEPHEIDAVLVPGVSFDLKGFRIGYGKGFYDRFLARFDGLKIGVAYSVQVSSQPLPVESFDMPVDVLATEQYIYKPLDAPLKSAVRE